MYLGGEKDILEIFGYGEKGEVKGEDGKASIYAFSLG